MNLTRLIGVKKMKVETLKEDMRSETEKQKLSYLNKLMTEQIQTRSFHLIFK